MLTALTWTVVKHPKDLTFSFALERQDINLDTTLQSPMRLQSVTNLWYAVFMEKHWEGRMRRTHLLTLAFHEKQAPLVVCIFYTMGRPL